VDKVRYFSDEQYTAGLESWRFLKLRSLRPLFTSPFGDVFFGARNGVWFLDTLESSFRRISRSQSELSALLSTDAGTDEYLMLGLAEAAERAGIAPGRDQIYDFVLPPALGHQ
jgi:hypothetical protein